VYILFRYKIIPIIVNYEKYVLLIKYLYIYVIHICKLSYI